MEYLIRSKRNSIPFIEYKDKLYLVNPDSLSLNEKEISFESGHLENNRMKVSLTSASHLDVYGDTYTLVI